MPPVPSFDVQRFFKLKFGYTPTHIVRAPGRLELLGNHTDYNEGLVLSLAIDRYVYIACAPRSDARIELASSAFPEVIDKFWMSDFKRNSTALWADYVKGVLASLRHHGVHFSGFNAAIHSTIPLGAGLGSSAALEVATALAIRQLYPYRLASTGVSAPPRRDSRGRLPLLNPVEKMQLAKVCQRAENHFVGAHTGLLDQISSIYGKEFHAMQIDFKHLTVELLSLVGELAVIVCDSGVKHQHTSGKYNSLREFCESAARELKAKSLRTVELKYLAAHKHDLTPREYQCAYHIVGENQRVVFGTRAISEGDFVQFGQYLLQSHESSRDFFKNSTPELDLLVELARAHPACLGARLTGGGFGGSTINLVTWNLADDFMASIASQYLARTGHPLAPMRCRIVDGAGVERERAR
jgi:galactokinase